LLAATAMLVGACVLDFDKFEAPAGTTAGPGSSTTASAGGLGGAGGDPATTTSSTGGAGATGGMIGACENEMIDGSESDVDCGGGICPRCPDGAHCNGDGDCTSHFCSG